MKAFLTNRREQRSYQTRRQWYTSIPDTSVIFFSEKFQNSLSINCSSPYLVQKSKTWMKRSQIWNVFKLLFKSVVKNEVSP